MTTRKPKRTAEPEPQEVSEDDGRPVRLDRPLTPAEAQAQDEENRARLLENKRRRFGR